MKNLKNKNLKIKIVAAVLSFAFCSAGVPSLFAAEKLTARQYFDKGLEAENLEEYHTATQNFLEAVRVNPSYTDAWFHLSQVSFYLGEPDLALQYLENAEKTEKDTSRINNLKGMIFLSLGRHDEANEIFNSILKKYPNDVNAHFGLAELQLYDGRFSGAKKEYDEALKRQGDNKKALLSIALLYAYTRDFTESQNYLRRALNYYSHDPSVHYLASVIYCMKGDLTAAENQVRIAVELNGNYAEAYHLLAQILYYEERYNDVIDLCDFQIAKDRSDSISWYLKGLAQNKNGEILSSIQTWSTGLNVNPQDEIMRMMMEITVRDNVSLEDSRRASWAKYHVNIANQNSERYDGVGASYEYQRALRIDPMNREARLAYANMLELNGMHELYLEQLKFVQDFSAANEIENAKTEIAQKSRDEVFLNDTIEAYSSLLQDTLAKKWNVQPFYLDKIRWNIAIFYEERAMNFIHADADKLTALAASDIFSGVAQTSVKTQSTPISGYGDAFKNARTNGFDYFVILSLDEGSDDMTLNATMYSARTGTETEKMTFYATGNNRYATVLRRFRAAVLENLPVRGKIIQRKAKTCLIDLGKSEHIENGAEFQIIRKGKITTADTGTGLFYKEDDILGTLTVTVCGEEVSECSIKAKGFYDRINDGDEVVLISLPETKTDDAIDTAPVSDAKGNVVVNQKVENNNPLSNEIKKAVATPQILELIQNIY